MLSTQQLSSVKLYCAPSDKITVNLNLAGDDDSNVQGIERQQQSRGATARACADLSHRCVHSRGHMRNTHAAHNTGTLTRPPTNTYTYKHSHSHTVINTLTHTRTHALSHSPSSLVLEPEAGQAVNTMLLLRHWASRSPSPQATRIDPVRGMAPAKVLSRDARPPQHGRILTSTGAPGVVGGSGASRTTPAESDAGSDADTKHCQ